MNYPELVNQIKKKKSFLCVGLDTDLNKIPKHLLDTEDPIFEFNKQIIDATKDFCVAYKPNIAFYEMLGTKGWDSLQKTIDYIPNDIFTIADAKRGDIGNTSLYYANTFFDTYDFDSVTVAPYMGSDSVTPYLQHKDKWAIVLALTSNKGADDFELQKLESGEYVFEKVLSTSKEWGSEKNMMYVVGATRPEMLAEIRKIVPNHFLLVPGVGAQGGSLTQVVKYGMTKDVGLLVNSSRGIIYAGNGEDFAQKAGEKAKSIQEEMASLMS
ncbi:orotidine-5'-phosphate decarboxylase [Flavobacteriales bacterium]|jgi:orotidine-5'-phosphate decarboxylase|nr:orotidine-5'-phosphate decarboxylase [Flavobacteriales bacterium]MDB4195373.1 orotidine-5'-phosphate decarboxylase [Flavobacteriales bacterium]MDB9701905.1 orotidine-5'-phosphate decarboxylase [Flavobacteriales bacterium]MDB9931802.1 orotidine-5'-phosphate decarboxylase [Flavobacteriales bacterium]|tara:strand:- start:4819 stop:5625 length:807 start_codon:yes stop_codon:yes gene_type:complete